MYFFSGPPWQEILCDVTVGAIKVFSGGREIRAGYISELPEAGFLSNTLLLFVCCSAPDHAKASGILNTLQCGFVYVMKISYLSFHIISGPENDVMSQLTAADSLATRWLLV